MLPIICPRVGAGVAAQLGKAACAASKAAFTSALVDRGNSPRVSVNIAGFMEVKVAPSLDEVNCPLIML